MYHTDTNTLGDFCFSCCVALEPSLFVLISRILKQYERKTVTARNRGGHFARVTPLPLKKKVPKTIKPLWYRSNGLGAHFSFSINEKEDSFVVARYKTPHVRTGESQNIGTPLQY